MVGYPCVKKAKRKAGTLLLIPQAVDSFGQNAFLLLSRAFDLKNSLLIDTSTFPLSASVDCSVLPSSIREDSYSGHSVASLSSIVIKASSHDDIGKQRDSRSSCRVGHF